MQTQEKPCVIERFDDFGKETRGILQKYEGHIPSLGHLLLYFKLQEERILRDTETVRRHGIETLLQENYDPKGCMLGCIAFGIVFSQLAESGKNIRIKHSIPVYTHETYFDGRQVSKQENLQTVSKEFEFNGSADTYREWAENFLKMAETNKILLKYCKI